MSEQSKREAVEIVKVFRRIQQEADAATKKAAGFDKDLASKIKKVGADAAEVSKHVEEKLSPDGN
jgi:heterodisulfide reductase subunit C